MSRSSSQAAKASRPKRTRQRAGVRPKKRLAKRPTLTPQDRAALEAKLGYTFSEEGWLNRALTHPSLIDNYDGDAQFSNQRLEFLGDRVLGLVMAEMLTVRFPDEREGYLTKIYHQMVSGEACASVGEQFGLRAYLFMDESMQNNKPGSYDKAVADAVEALIAAIYRDGGIEAAGDFIRRHWILTPIQAQANETQNPKTLLSDWCGANAAPYATYQLIAREGPDHAPIFTVRAQVKDRGSAEAKGGNKQEAEMAAAAALLTELDRDDRH
ncbi:MAG: ribonuclease III [Pseudomonadota bacterium]